MARERPMGSALIRLALLAAAMALATLVVGWWGIAAAAALLALIDSRPAVPRDAAIGAGLGWAVLLLVAVAGGGVPEVVRGVGGATGIPGPALVVTAVAFPAALAWSAAAVIDTGRALMGAARRRVARGRSGAP